MRRRGSGWRDFMIRNPSMTCDMTLAGSPRIHSLLTSLPALACEISVTLCGRSCYTCLHLCSCLFTLLL